VTQKQQIIIDAILEKLSHSKFRSRFRLNKKDINYINEKGIEIIEKHAKEFIEIRLSPKDLEKDGKQTPMRGHPVFLAQHATATCCRGCMEKWHHIKKGTSMTKEQQNYAVAVIMEWINRQRNTQELNEGNRNEASFFDTDRLKGKE